MFFKCYNTIISMKILNLKNFLCSPLNIPIKITIKEYIDILMLLEIVSKIFHLLMMSENIFQKLLNGDQIFNEFILSRNYLIGRNIGGNFISRMKKKGFSQGI